MFLFVVATMVWHRFGTARWRSLSTSYNSLSTFYSPVPHRSKALIQSADPVGAIQRMLFVRSRDSEIRKQPAKKANHTIKAFT
jgi:hypothetical protein